MNYRHAYHAGNFADVLKHAVLAQVIAYMKRKEAPFRVIDTHAGCGRYDLGTDAAMRTGEWRAGIGRLVGPNVQPLPDDLATFLGPYLEVVRRENPAGSLTVYPGSPAIADALLRRQDAMIANELHPEDRATLAAALAHCRIAKVMGLDAWTALKSLLPPKERRGVVLVDPPFEQSGDLERLVAGLGAAAQRFATGTYILWYPIKNPATITRFWRAIGELALPRLLRAELMIRAVGDGGEGLAGCGLIIVNPPYTLVESLPRALTLLSQRLAQGPGAGARVVDPSGAK